MGDQRQQKGPEPFSNREPDNTAGREENAATPLTEEQSTEVSPQAYPQVRQDDSVEAPARARRG